MHCRSFVSIVNFKNPRISCNQLYFAFSRDLPAYERTAYLAAIASYIQRSLSVYHVGLETQRPKHLETGPAALVQFELFKFPTLRHDLERM